MTAAWSFPLQYFVFDFHVSPDVMFDKIIKISVSGEQPLQTATGFSSPLCHLARWPPLWLGQSYKGRPVPGHMAGHGMDFGLLLSR